MSTAIALKTDELARPKSSIVLGQSEYKRIKAILSKDTGIELGDGKVSLVHSRLQKRLRKLGLTDFKVYCNLVESREGQDERKFLLNALTTNVTRFFREPHHFKHLLKVSLPPLIAKSRSGGRVRIWSGGCSSGQEPYSIAAVLLSLMPDAEKFDIKILASDIDCNMIEAGRRGEYDHQLMRHMPIKLRDKFFDVVDSPGDKRYAAKKNIKSLISFRELNLNAPSWPMRGKFDIIFCRNTVIYFDAATQEKLWTQFKAHMVDDGYIYIGHSERLTGPSADHFKKTDTITAFQLKA